MVNGSWPKSKDEVVLVLDDNNSVPLTTLYELGLLPASDYHEMMSKLNAGDKVSTPQDKIDYAKALDQTLYMIPASDQYVKGDDGHYRFIGNDKDESNSASKRPPNSRWWASSRRRRMLRPRRWPLVWGTRAL